MQNKLILFILVLYIGIQSEIVFCSQQPASSRSWGDWLSRTWNVAKSTSSNVTQMVRNAPSKLWNAAEQPKSQDNFLQNPVQLSQANKLSYHVANDEESGTTLDISPDEIMKYSIWYVMGPDEDQSATITKSEAIDRVKMYIKNLLDDQLEYPTPLTKIRSLLKKINILPSHVDYNDEIFTQACDQLVQEITRSAKDLSAKEQVKNKLIDSAIVRFNKQLASSQDKNKDILDLMSNDDRALSSIYLSLECERCDKEYYGVDNYAKIVNAANRRAPMTSDQKEKFEVRKKELAMKLKDVFAKQQMQLESQDYGQDLQKDQSNE